MLIAFLAFCLAAPAWSGNTFFVYAAVTSVATIGLYIAYILPIILRLRAGDKFEPGPWSLGRWYKPLNVIAIIWVIFISVLFIMPITDTAVWWNADFDYKTANYAPIAIRVVIARGGRSGGSSPRGTGSRVRSARSTRSSRLPRRASRRRSRRTPRWRARRPELADRGTSRGQSLRRDRRRLWHRPRDRVRLAEEGGRVLCTDVTGTRRRRPRRRSARAAAVTTDVSDPAQVDAMIARCVELHGTVDVLVNNAGVNIPGVLHEVPDEVIDRTLAVNVKGTIYGCRAAIPHMLENGGGSIVNISSVNGIVSEPYLAVYSASKGAVVMLTKGVALDYAKQGIRCNAICPGWVDTPINYAHAEMLGGLQQVYDTIDSFQPIGRPGGPRRSRTWRSSSPPTRRRS